MRLRRLVLERYGSFEHADLPLAVEPGRITVVVAPNGAGKSVLRHAFHDLLFDIPRISPMNFRHGYKGMRLHAEAVAGDGGGFTFGFERDARPQRVTSDLARYTALRAETTPEQLERLFALDTARLRQGGIDLKGGATLAAALLSGTGELASARRVQADVERRRDANWGTASRKPPLNAALIALAKAQDEAQRAVQRPAHREQQDRALAACKAEHAAAHAAQDTAQAAERRLNRVELVRPHLHALDTAGAWFAANPDAPALPADLADRLAQAREAKSTAATQEATTADSLQAAAAQAGRIPQDPAVASHQDALARLPVMLGNIEKADADAVDLQTKRAAAMVAIEAALRDIGATHPAEHAAALVPPVAAAAGARAAIKAHTGLASRLVAQADTLRQARLRVDDSPQPADTAASAPDGLAALLKEVTADRNPMQHAAAAAKDTRAKRAALEAALAKVPGWRGDAAGLLAVPPPHAAACERLDTARVTAAQAARDRTGERDRAATQLAALRAELAGLQADTLPDQSAIASARARRDRGWRLVAQRLDGAADLDGERAFAGSEPLGPVFEREMQAADALADRRLHELDRVTHAERLTLDVEKLEPGCDAARENAAAAHRAAEEAVSDWARAVAPLGLGPDATMGELLASLAARNRVVDATEALRVAEGEALALSTQHADWASRLAAMLGTSGEPLQGLFPRAEARLAAAAAADKARDQHAAGQKASEAAHRAALDAHEAALAAMEAWRGGWQRALAALGRPADETPAATEAVLDRLGALDRHVQVVAGLDQRLQGMQDDRARFAAMVQALAAALAEPEAATPAATARQLVARRDRAARDESAREQAASSLRVTRDAHGRAMDQVRLADQALAAVIAAAGARDEADGEARIAAARDYARHALLRDQAEAALRQHGAGLPPDTLRAEVAATPTEVVAAAREQAAADARVAGERAEDAAVALAKMQGTFDADAETTAALDATGRQAEAASVYARLLEEQIVLQLAASMLGQALSAVEAEAGDNGLARISAAFGAVTAGAYGVVLDEEDRSTLHALEHRYPGERKALGQLSEGTQDQLYLALRLVALRAHAEGATPLPFIADDILQTFDDTRAVAALHALVELSEVVQVVVLTHHEHVAVLAGSLPAGSASVIRLDQPGKNV